MERTLQTLTERLDRQDDKLDHQNEKLDQIMQAVTRQAAVCETTRTRVAAVCDTVYGNGHDGLTSRVKTLETVRSSLRYGLTTMVALVSVMVAVTGVVWAVISAFTK